MGEPVSPPTRRAVACAVIANPFAGRYEKDLEPLVEIGVELGDLLTKRCLAALGIGPEQAESFGKAAIVGDGGELEHAAAILHPKMGTPVRAALGKGPALIPSAKKMGGIGTAIDVPLGHKDAAFVRSHFDAVEARVPMRHGAARSWCVSRSRIPVVPTPHRRTAEARDQGRGRPALSGF